MMPLKWLLVTAMSNCVVCLEQLFYICIRLVMLNNILPIHSTTPLTKKPLHSQKLSVVNQRNIVRLDVLFKTV